MKKRLLTLAIILIIFLINYVIAFAQPPDPDAGAYILIDSDTGEALLAKNPDKTLYPASTTKIMTAILALERGDLDQEMTASQAAVDNIGPNGSNIGIIPGEKIRLENLLQALLISSANEAANIIAEHICGTREEFVELMNKKAAELGATGTHFANPSGIHDPMHYTTASDLARIARYAMAIPKFREIVSTPSFTMPPTNKHAQWPVLPNTNKLMISDESDLYEINGIKTGFTGQAGYNLVSSAKDGSGMELIAVVLCVKNEGAQENVRKYSKELLDYGFSNFKKVRLIEKGKVYRNIKVENAADIYGLDLITGDSLTCILPKSEPEQHIKEVVNISETVSAPVNKGDIMGYVEFFKDDVSIGKIQLIAARDIAHKPEPETLITRAEKLFGNFFVRMGLYIAAFIVFFMLLRLVLKHVSRRLRSHRRRYL